MTGYTDIILDILARAGAVALETQENIRHWNKADGSIVTNADLRITRIAQDALSSILQDPRHMLLDEETFETGGPAPAVHLAEYTWVLDPIGGTAAYKNNLPFFGIYLGILKDGAPWMGAVYLPRLGELFLCDSRESFYITDAFLPTEQRRKIIFTPAGIDRDCIFFASGRFETSLCMNMNPYTMGISLCYPPAGKGIGASVRGKLWDICGAWPLIQQSHMRLRSMKTGQTLERFDLACFDASLKLKDTYILSTEEVFEKILHSERTAPHT